MKPTEIIIDNRLIEVNHDINGNRGVKFTLMTNRVINEFLPEKHFDCSPQDSDQELLHAAIEWYKETWLAN